MQTFLSRLCGVSGLSGDKKENQSQERKCRRGGRPEYNTIEKTSKIKCISVPVSITTKIAKNSGRENLKEKRKGGYLSVR